MSRQYVLDTVLRQHLRDVQIGPDPEGDCDGEVAIPRRLTAHVEHILDTVDLLLERRRNGACDCFRRCTGICRRDLDRRRDDFWILCDR